MIERGIRWGRVLVSLWFIIIGLVMSLALSSKEAHSQVVVRDGETVEQAMARSRGREVYRERLPAVREVRTTVLNDRVVVRGSRTGVEARTRIPICPRGRIWSRVIGMCTAVDVNAKHERRTEERTQTRVRSDTLRYDR
jgi:hypothetical protein